MDSKRECVKLRGARWQYSLPVLFAVVTFLCVAFAYPRFVLGWAGLLISTLFVLVAFAVLVYYPVVAIANRIRSRGSKADEAGSDVCNAPTLDD